MSSGEDVPRLANAGATYSTGDVDGLASNERAVGRDPADAVDLLYSSQAAVWNLETQELQSSAVAELTGDVDADYQADGVDTTYLARHYERGHFRATPVRVRIRNRQANAVTLSSEWDGVNLSLDVSRANPAAMDARDGLAAIQRYYRHNPRKLASAVGKLAVLLTLLFVLQLFAFGFVP